MIVLVGLTAMVAGDSAAVKTQMQKDVYGSAKPAHVNQGFVHSDGDANHNRFKGVGMGDDSEPDGDAGFPAASFSAVKPRASALAASRQVMGSGSFAKAFKKWVATKLVGGKQQAKIASLATTALEEAADSEDEDEDEDETNELIFGFFILLLPLIVLVVVLLILLPFMIAKANGDAAPTMPEMPGGGEYADQAQEHLKSTSDLVVKYLSPVEEMSPFKVGQIKELISKVNEDAGTAVAPFFIVLQVLFLLAFVGYFVVAVVALCLDWMAMDCECAADSWVWLYVLLVVVIPTSFGFLMGLVKAGLALADLKKNVGWEIPDVFLALPGPVIYITLGILGIILWSTMDAECDSLYSETYGMLYIIFKIQVILIDRKSVV